MIRYLAMTCILLVLAPVQAALAEIEKIAVTPEYLKANPDAIRVKTVHDDKVSRFEVRLRLDKPQHVTTQLVTRCGDTEQIFATASVITESETTVQFSVAMKSISDATLHLGVGGYDLKDGIAKPWLGGTTYVIKPGDFVTGTASEAGKQGGSNPSEASGEPDAVPLKRRPNTSNPAFVAGVEPDAASSKLAVDSGIAFLSQATAQGDEVIPSEIGEQIKKKGLVEIHVASDNIDTSRVIVFLGKRGKVELRPGTSVFVELPRPTKEFSWQAGDAPEAVGDAELPSKFTHIWCRWSSTGELKWTCYGAENKAPR